MSSTREGRRDEAVAEYLLALDAGQRPDRDDWLARHADVAEELRAFFADQERLTRLAGPLKSLAPRDTPTVAFDTPAPNGSAPAAVAPARLADYELLGELGRGGMGVVYKARDSRINRVVALKMILPGRLAAEEQVRRFRQEAEDAGRLDHPNIVPIYQVGEENGQPYFTMKLIEGGSLGDLAARFRAEPRAAASFLATVARAVHYAHQHGILHRDLKPGNILVDADGRPHVTDFGLAKHLAARDPNTQTGAVVGTPSYMAPEQASGRKDLTVAADVYSLGVVLYELLTGGPPFHNDNPFDTLRQVVEAEPTPPRALNPRVDRDLETVCLTCLRKEPARRYPSAEALADDLGRYLTGEPIQARRVGRLERATKWVRRRPAAAALVAVAALAAVALPLLGVGGWYSLHLREANRQLQHALDVAEQERRQAEQERAKVAESRARHFDLIDDLLTKFDARLERMQGLDSVRLEFLAEAQRLSDQLRHDQPDDPQVLRQAARVSRSLGELALLRGKWPEAEAALARARAIQELLVADFPDDVKYQTDLALTYGRQGELYTRTRHHEAAVEAYDRAIDAHDRLRRRFPGAEEHRERCASSRFLKANLLEEMGRLDGALPLYHACVADQEELLRLNPRQAARREELATTVTSLGYALEATDPARAVTWLERAVALARGGGSHSALRLAYADLAEFYKRHRQHAELARLAADLRQDFPGNSGDTYNAACFTADAARAARDGAGLDPAERPRLADQYAARAVALLRQATQQGFTDREHMAKDPDLDPLRGRADFEKLTAELDRRFPSGPVTPASLLASLRRDYTARQDYYQSLRGEARTVAEKKRAAAHKPSFDACAGPVLDLADKNPQLPASFDALAWVLENAEPGRDGPPARALQLLQRDHLANKDLARICRILTKHPLPAADDFLGAVAARGADAATRALATYTLGLSLKERAEAAFGRGGADTAEQMFRQAQKALEEVIQRDGGVVLESKAPSEVAAQPLAAAARRQLAELLLSPGRPAQAVEGPDLDGRPMKLSDYKGRVVLVSFWANWCGFCRQMYPDERALVEKMNGRPFVLLGVNADSDREVARAAVMRNKLNWRSWTDEGGKLHEAWQVDSFPALYLLDAAGVIRKKWEGTPGRGDIEKAVEELVAQAERAG